MARTVQEIYDSIIAEKESMASLNGLQPAPDTAQTFLADLTSTSKVAIWRLWAWITAVAHWALEKLWDSMKSDMQEIADSAQPQTDRWYKKKLYEFQYPDSLVFVDNVPQFSPVDESLQVIKYAAVASGTNNDMVVKVAGDSGGSPAPFSSTIVTAIESYMNAIKAPGTSVTVLSLNADKLKLQYDYYYDPKYDLNTIKTDLEAAINSYLRDQDRTNFNGVINLMAIEDRMQLVQGYKRLRRIQASWKVGTGSLTSFDVDYQSVAGYAIISPDAGETFADTFNFIADP